ncbi:MAG: hypothetical protein HW383_214 [Candidatus Magasanikbacteria bacterium]|nr:hypothetical protein [Candidatus Magasanikbacteria bacterium]
MAELWYIYDMLEQHKNLGFPAEKPPVAKVKEHPKEIEGERDLVRFAWDEFKVAIGDEDSVKEGLDRFARDPKKLKKLIAMSAQWKVIQEHNKKELESTVLPSERDNTKKMSPSYLVGRA